MLAACPARRTSYRRCCSSRPSSSAPSPRSATRGTPRRCSSSSGCPGSCFACASRACCPYGELVLAAFLLLASGVWYVLATTVTLLLFVAYFLVILRAVRLPYPVSCSCFGRLGLGEVTGWTLARNGVLLALALVTWVDSWDGEGVAERLGDLGGWAWVVAGLGVAAAAAAFVGRVRGRGAAGGRARPDRLPAGPGSPRPARRTRRAGPGAGPDRRRRRGSWCSATRQHDPDLVERASSWAIRLAPVRVHVVTEQGSATAGRPGAARPARDVPQPARRRASPGAVRARHRPDGRRRTGRRGRTRSRAWSRPWRPGSGWPGRRRREPSARAAPSDRHEPHTSAPRGPRRRPRSRRSHRLQRRRPAAVPRPPADNAAGPAVSATGRPPIPRRPPPRPTRPAAPPTQSAVVEQKAVIKKGDISLHTPRPAAGPRPRRPAAHPAPRLPRRRADRLRHVGPDQGEPAGAAGAGGHLRRRHGRPRAASARWCTPAAAAPTSPPRSSTSSSGSAPCGSACATSTRSSARGDHRPAAPLRERHHPAPRRVPVAQGAARPPGQPDQHVHDRPRRLRPAGDTPRPPSTADHAGFLTGLRHGWTALTDTVVVGLTALGAVLPFALLLAAIGLPVWWWLRRHGRAGPATPAEAGSAE